MQTEPTEKYFVKWANKDFYLQWKLFLITNLRDAQESLGHSDRHLYCDSHPSTSVVCDVQIW